MTPNDPAAPPVELRVESERTALRVAWPDGTASTISAARLRGACRCAQCTAQRAIGPPVSAAPTLAITTVEPIGSYAVNIGFSDGHARGVFPWAFLRQLAGETSPGSA